MSAFPATPSRSAALPLFLGAGVAGFGLGLLALAVALPEQNAAPLPPPVPAERGTVATAVQIESDALAEWAPVFGVPAPEPAAPPPAPEPEPEPEPDYAPYVDLTEYRLQGLVVADGGGWAMIESDEGVAVFRPGDYLPGGEQLVGVEEDGIEVELDGDYYFIGFDDSADPYDDGLDLLEDERDLGPDMSDLPARGSGEGGGSAPIMGPVGTGRVGR